MSGLTKYPSAERDLYDGDESKRDLSERHHADGKLPGAQQHTCGKLSRRCHTDRRLPDCHHTDGLASDDDEAARCRDFSRLWIPAGGDMHQLPAVNSDNFNVLPPFAIAKAVKNPMHQSRDAGEIEERFSDMKEIVEARRGPASNLVHGQKSHAPGGKVVLFDLAPRQEHDAIMARVPVDFPEQLINRGRFPFDNLQEGTY